ncbi:LITAF-like zinc ribbon domain-containing protein [Aspergillus oleicola]
MSEKATYVLEPQAPAPPPSYEAPANAAPIAELGTQPRSVQPEPEIQLQTLPSQQSPQHETQYGTITPQPDGAPRQEPGSWNPDLQMYPPQKYAPAPQPNQYPTAVPLHALQRTSQVVDCPICHQREMTQTEGVNGKTTHGWAAVLCFCACVGCIPYFVAAFKDINHLCGKCGKLLATYHGSGHVVVHQKQGQQSSTIA